VPGSRSLAAYRVPRSVEFVPDLPKNAMMKTLRRELRDRELDLAGTSL
jgi:acyl-coenzyme A synthetase/AMP-(fatty) acid ligase